jgi:hypothetical protein
LHVNIPLMRQSQLRQINQSHASLANVTNEMSIIVASAHPRQRHTRAQIANPFALL